MKKRLVIISFALATIFAFGFLGCSQKPDNATATAYGVLHKQYAGRVTISASKDGKVTDVKFEEFLPITEIGKVSNHQEVELNEEHQIEGFAKWIKIGDQVFTYTDVDGQYVYRNDKWAKGDKFELVATNNALAVTKKSSYENPEFSKWYIERVSEGDFYICKNALGTETYEIPFTKYGKKENIAKKDWADKSKNGYWLAEDYPTMLGWSANIQKLETAIKAHGLNDYTGREVNGENGFTLGANSTGATLVDYHQYMRLAKEAYLMTMAIMA